MSQEKYKFKNIGNTVSVENSNSKNIRQTRQPIGIKLPLELGKSYGESLFRMNFNIADQISQNLRSLLMTRKGERLCFSDFGTNLQKIFSLKNEENLEEIAMEEIRRSTSKFFPFVSLVNFISSEVTNDNDQDKIYKITIEYTIPSISNNIKELSVYLRTES